MCMWSGDSCEDNPYHRRHHGPFGGGNNCSVPDWDNATGTFNLGTLEDYRHLMLAAVRWWNQTLVQGLVPTMARMYNSSAFNISSEETFHYWEADIVGTVAYPQGIKMVIGTFGSLFGSEYGEALQAWCRRQGWVLLWALGPGDGGGGKGMDFDSPPAPVDARTTRMLDPSVLPSATAGRNTSVAEYADSFTALWKKVGAARTSNTTAAEYAAWFAELPTGLAARGLMAGECADASRCVGTRADGACICYV